MSAEAASLPRATNTHRAAPWLPATLLAILLACRMVLLIFMPHQDPSEARYAEISRKMAERGDWITPQHLYGVPFWAKPPLSMWMSAAGMKVFGVNEFGSRIVIFLAALAILALVGWFAAGKWSARAGWAGAVMLLGMPLFFYCSAAVMTDLALLAGITLAMIAFHRAVTTSSKPWGYLFFTALAMGLLAKGPLTLVLAGPPLLGWLLLSRQVKAAWRAVPWITGTLLMLALSVPWYVLAEQRTPGFIDYFILGEHWHRFVTRGWQGDLYGSAHAVAPGTIWLFALAGTFPWCLGLLAAPLGAWRNFSKWAARDHGTGWFLLLWALWPLVFFTAARNVISTYPLPALPAIALLLAAVFHERAVIGLRRFHPLHPAFAGVTLALVAGTFAVTVVFPRYSPKSSERDIVRAFDAVKKPGDQLIFFGRRKYSAEFYSAGHALNTRSADELRGVLQEPSTLYAAMSEKSHRNLPADIRVRLARITATPGGAILFKETVPPSLASSPHDAPSS